MTFNLGDFPADRIETYGIEAQHPDEFIAHLFDLDEMAVLEAVRQQLAALRNPPIALDEVNARFRRLGLAGFATLLERRRALLL